LRIGNIVVERRFGRYAFGFAVRRDFAVVDAVGEPPQPLAFAAEPAHEIRFAHRLYVADGAEAVAREPLLRHRADAPDEADGLGREKRFRLRAPDEREPARLVEIGGDLRQEFAIAQTH